MMTLGYIHLYSHILQGFFFFLHNLTLSFCKPTVALVYGAQDCVAIRGVRKDVVACTVWMLESDGAERRAVKLRTCGGKAPVCTK